MKRFLAIALFGYYLFASALFPQTTQNTPTPTDAKEDKKEAEVEKHEEKIATAEDEFVPLSDLKPLEVTQEYKHKHSFQYGLSAANTFIIDNANLKNGYFLGNYRPYLKYIYKEQHIFNARGKFAYKNNPSITDDQKKVGAVGSTAEYNFELMNAELHFDRHQVTAGRAFYRMGRGLLFANFADGAEYTGAFKWLYVKALAAYSGQYSGCMISLGGCATSGDIAQKGLYDIVPGRPADVNIPDPGRRLFLGAEIQSPQLYGSSAYLVGLYSRDMSRDAATSGTNKGKLYAYDPISFGLGLSGFIITPRLRYLAEFIMQRGSTYNKSKTTGGTISNEETGVNAWGLTADINYSLPILEKLLKPGLVFQYATGSGRKSSEKDTTNLGNPAQENISGDDNNFYYFGGYSAGLALKPKLSNLHIIRLGFQFRPLHHFYWGRNLMIAAKYTYYRKVNAAYNISDSAAKLEKSTVGQGLDFQMVWDIRSDVKLFYAYGIFLPSEAYDAKDAKTLHTHIISLNFLF